MEYSKPELTSVGRAVEAIESSLTKGPIPLDSGVGADQTDAPAYEANE
jgi:hypothetical protein